MRSKAFLVGVVVALTLSVGCGRSKPADGDSFTGKLALKRLQRGEQCSYDEMGSDFAVRNTKNSYAALWKKLFKGEPPELDLDSYEVLVALRGQQQDLKNTIEIVGADQDGEAVVVRVKMHMATGLPRRKQCSPYDVVALKKVKGVKVYRFVDAGTGEQLERTEAF